MTQQTATEIVIAVVGFILSIGMSIFLSGVRWGKAETRIEMLERDQHNFATKEQVEGLKEDLKEIKGMFRMTLRYPDMP